MKKIELEKLEIEIDSGLNRWSPLYWVLKRSLSKQGYWKNHPRGDPKKGFKSGMGKGIE